MADGERILLTWVFRVDVGEYEFNSYSKTEIYKN